MATTIMRDERKALDTPRCGRDVDVTTRSDRVRDRSRVGSIAHQIDHVHRLARVLTRTKKCVAEKFFLSTSRALRRRCSRSGK
jgi:hypothetical protein